MRTRGDTLALGAARTPWLPEEVTLSRTRALLIVPLGLFAALTWSPARGQNLDAGKPASQIFGEVCANCHRSTREVRGATASFLREHYTTGSEMASSMASYLSSGAVDRSPAPPQPKRPPAPTGPTTAGTVPPAPIPSAPAAANATGRDAPATTRGRPTTPDPKPVAAAPAPIRPVLEEFEE
jgi:hypothetical protein